MARKPLLTTRLHPGIHQIYLVPVRLYYRCRWLGQFGFCYLGTMEAAQLRLLDDDHQEGRCVDDPNSCSYFDRYQNCGVPIKDPRCEYDFARGSADNYVYCCLVLPRVHEQYVILSVSVTMC